MAFAVDPGGKGTALIQWDGLDQSDNLVPNGLGAVDFTDGGTNSQVLFRLVTGFEPATIILRAYSGQTGGVNNYSEYTYNHPGGIQTGQSVDVAILFSSFTTAGGSGANWTQIGAFEILIDGTLTEGTDLSIDFAVANSARDFGDLPDGYPVTLSENGARHIPSGLRLGNNLDTELDGTHSADATYDDTHVGAVVGTPDDEDGVTKANGLGGFPGWTNGTVASGNGGAVNVTIVGGQACLGAMFNFAHSGTTLTPVTLRNASGVEVSQPIAPGSYTFYFDIVPPAFNGTDIRPINARFRVTSPVNGCEGAVAFNPTGEASSGEVEDYQWPFKPNAVTLSGMTASSAATPLALPLGIVTFLGVLVGGIVLARRPV